MVLLYFVIESPLYEIYVDINLEIRQYKQIMQGEMVVRNTVFHTITNPNLQRKPTT